ncbi:MAG TPA: hypothetical protein VIJ62_00930 [Rhizomicrobium sp.]
MSIRKLPLLLAALLVSGRAYAVDFSFQGYAEFRGGITDGEDSYLDGGLGKLRFGGGDGQAQFDAVGQVHAQILPELSAVVVGRLDPYHELALDMTEAYLRYRPISTDAWRFTFKAGAFFPPFSLENTDIGWTSYWTITPSAINSWIGDELRIIGTEGKVEWRGGDWGTLSLTGALYGWNEPAGVLMADRGWALDDRPAGLFEREREPDAMAVLFGAPIPLQTELFSEEDGHTGWYLQGMWDVPGIGKIEIERYKNQANDAAEKNGAFAWETHFYSGGLETSWREFTLMAQGMSGYTAIEPIEDVEFETRFKSVFALAGWERGDWRLALRGDLFQTREQNPGVWLPTSEDGHALTAAGTWTPHEWLRLTAEVLYVDSTRDQRAVVGLDPHQTQTQFQLLARFYN